NQAVAWGVPPERIRMETVSLSTRESLVAIAPLLRREGVRSVALVAAPFHQRRTYLTPPRALPRVGLLDPPASPPGWAPRAWWRTARSRQIVLSEYAKIVYYAVRGWI